MRKLTVFGLRLGGVEVQLMSVVVHFQSSQVRENDEIAAVVEMKHRPSSRSTSSIFLNDLIQSPDQPPSTDTIKPVRDWTLDDLQDNSNVNQLPRQKLQVARYLKTQRQAKESPKPKVQTSTKLQYHQQQSSDLTYFPHFNHIQPQKLPKKHKVRPLAQQMAAYGVDLRQEQHNPIPRKHPKRLKSTRVNQLPSFKAPSTQELENAVAAEKELASTIQTNIVHVRRTLPIEFLLDRHHDLYAQDMAIESMFRLFHQQHLEIIFQSLCRWKHLVNQQRIDDRAAQILLLSRIAGLRRGLTIIQTKHRSRQRQLLHRWKKRTDHLRALEEYRSSLMIQSAWRCSQSRHRVAVLRAERDFRIQTQAALQLQCLFRGFRARCRVALLKQQILEAWASQLIFKTVRRYTLRRMFQKAREAKAALRIQTRVRGILGRRDAIDRKQSFMVFATIIYSIAVTSSIQVATHLHYSSIIIQRSFRCYSLRQIIYASSLKARERRQFFPSFRIQRSWKRYHMGQIDQALRNIIASIEAYYHRSAQLITSLVHRCGIERKYKAAQTIQKHIRGGIGRQDTYRLQLIHYDTLKCELYRVWTYVCYQLPQCHGFASQSTLRETNCVLYSMQLDYDSRRYFAAITIQRNARGRQGRQAACRFIGARKLLEVRVPILVKAHLRRKMRIRVLARWKKKTRRIFVRHFRGWKAYFMALKKQRQLQHEKDQMNKAIRFNHHQLLKAHFQQHWKEYYEYRLVKLRLRKKAQDFYEMKLRRQVWQSWFGFAEDMVVDDIVWQAKHYAIDFHSWVEFAHESKMNRAARKLFVYRTCSTFWQQWQSYCLVQQTKYLQAIEHYDKHLQKRAFHCFHFYVRQVQAADQINRKNQFQRSIRLWLKNQAYQRAFKQLEQKADAHYHTQRQALSFHRWSRLKSIRLAKEARNAKADMQFQHWGWKRGLWDWLAWGIVHAKYSHLVNQATRKYHETLWKKGYHGIFHNWAIHVGLQRMEAALKIQTNWRAKKARKIVAGLRVMYKYKFEMRVKSKADLHEITPDQLFDAFWYYQWVVVIFYFPWALPSEDMLLEVAKAATTLNTVPSLYICMVDANTADSTGTSISFRYGLKEGLPALYPFWQGRGIFSDYYKRFKQVLNYDPVPMKCPSIITWFEFTNQAARRHTAIQLQAFARGFIARQRLSDLRIEHKNRRATQLQTWYKYRCSVYSTRITNRAALRIQRWYRRRLIIIAFVTGFQHQMRIYRAPVLVIQRAIRAYFCRQLFSRCLEEKYATAEKYPQAPICCECDATLALMKCNECEDPYCNACFAAYHNKGARARHTFVAIAFKAMHENLYMCTDCEVQETRRICKECNDALCIVCFEKQHTKRNGDLIKHNWQSARTLPKKKFKGPRGILAQEVLDKNSWMSVSRFEAKAKAEMEAAEAERVRLEKLEQIKAENEQFVREAFDLYDADGSGSIDRDELKHMLLKELCEPVTDAELNEVMDSIDTDKNGTIEFYELLEWMAQGIYSGARQSTKIAVLRKTLQAKKRLRLAREHLKNKLPTLPHQETPVTGYTDVFPITQDEFEDKHPVFLRFLHTEYGFDWVYEDVENIEEGKMRDLFTQLFVKRWNEGSLSAAYYYDGVVFQYNDIPWQYKWKKDIAKYVYLNLDTEVEHAADPRLEEQLRSDAQIAFQEADSDNSGDIDPNELYHLLVGVLCEPTTRDQVDEIMTELDTDGNGTIDFEEFFTWYASEQSQKSAYSSKLEALRYGLKAQRQTKIALKNAATAGLAGGIKMKNELQAKLRQKQLELDSKGASPELIILLKKGHAKALAVKALELSNNDPGEALAWLEERAEEAAVDKARRDAERQKLLTEKTAALVAASSVAATGAAKVGKALKNRIFKKKRTHETNVQNMLQDLEDDLLNVD